MIAVVRVEFEVEANNEDAIYDRIADLTYGMRSDRDVSRYKEEIVDLG